MPLWRRGQHTGSQARLMGLLHRALRPLLLVRLPPAIQPALRITNPLLPVALLAALGSPAPRVAPLGRAQHRGSCRAGPPDAASGAGGAPLRLYAGLPDVDRGRRWDGTCDRAGCPLLGGRSSTSTLGRPSKPHGRLGRQSRVRSSRGRCTSGGTDSWFSRVLSASLSVTST